MGGLEPGDPGVVARLADAAATVGADTERSATRGDERGRAAAAAAGRAGEVVGIVGAAVQIIVGFATTAHFRDVRQAEDDGSFGPQPRHRRRVVLCYGAKRGTAAGAGQPGHPHDVLDHYRQPVRPAQPVATRGTAVRLVGPLQALIRISSCDKSVEHWIDEVDSGQMRLGNLSARQGSSRHQPNQFVSR